MSVPRTALFTDFYELTMMQGYYRAGLHKRQSCFDLFFRYNPFGGGYTIAAGLEDALKFLESISFSDDEIEFLKENGLFEKDFLEFLKRLRFTGNVHAVAEGTPVFPMEPMLTVRGELAQCQLVETALLNIINFQSLIATKSARVCLEAGRDNVLEFGMRRAQGEDGAITAARAAYIGGCAATSNVAAGKLYGIPLRGTHAHSWIMAFDSELEAFHKYAEQYPKNSILLVDTYNTLKSGVPNAITVALEMEQRGEKLTGIRLDSGDLAYLSQEARKMLDAAGLNDIKIICSGDLDEFIIHDLKAQSAKIDIYGVGTKLVTACGDPALPGVYKMAAWRESGGWEMKLKISDSMKKSTLPGVKQVWRMRNGGGDMIADIVELEDKKPDFSRPVCGHHPFIDYRKKIYDNAAATEPLLEPVFSAGRITGKTVPLEAIRNKVGEELKSLHPTFKRLLNPHIYKVSLGPALMEQTRRLRNQNQSP
ncbi:MAG: nicotinate phosphoribosyltransferase [Nitrospinota bacterium]